VRFAEDEDSQGENEESTAAASTAAARRTASGMTATVTLPPEPSFEFIAAPPVTEDNINSR